MKHYIKNHITARWQLLSLTALPSLALLASLALPLPALAASVALATQPLAVSTTVTVQPNVTFLLDNSGSMSWEHMPDDNTDQGSSVTFSYGYYGLRSSQCNQAYYNPAVTYEPPLYANETSYPDASFNSALPHGFQAAGTTIVSAAGDKNYTNTAVDLNGSFKAHLPASYSTVAGDTFAQGAYYYRYSGGETTLAKKNYNSTTNAFYLECKDSTGGSVSAIAPVNGVKAATGGAPTTAGTGVFTKVRLSNVQTTTLTVSGTGGASTSASVSGITVNGVQIMNAASATQNNISSSTMAANIAAQIIAKTVTSGFSATVAGSVVTITKISPTDYATTVANFTPVITSITGNLGTIKVIPDVFPETDAAKLTNFANWYSFYRTRMLMMKTAAGRAFSKLDKNYRVGLIKLSASATPVKEVATFWNNTDTSLGPVSTFRSDWYSALYAMPATSSTPLRTALSNAGKYYAGKLSGVTDPMQYSCQQNFTILSTDGFWNDTTAPTVLSGSVGNSDGAEKRPYNDGTQAVTTTVTTYKRNSYSAVNTGCTGTQVRLATQPQYGTCSLTTTAGATENCDWVNGPGPYAIGSLSYGSCASSVVIPFPNPSTRQTIDTPAITTSGSVTGYSGSLADVALYYYKTDLRTTTLNNCTSGSSSKTLCAAPVAPATTDAYDNVFISPADSNTQQHMVTFTLGMGASGKMQYSKSYSTDTDGDYVAARLGLKASSTVCTWQSAGTTCNWPQPGFTGSDGLISNIDDMWHAAVNGRGAYFAATDPTTLADGLSNALMSIGAKKGAAAAAATSTLNPVAGNNYAYVASYTTVKWSGNLEARGINVDNAKVNENASWCVQNVPAGACVSPSTVETDTSGATTAKYCVSLNTICTNPSYQVGADCKIPVATACTGTMNALVSDVSDTRAIKTPNPGGSALMNFDAAYAAANLKYFNSNSAAHAVADRGPIHGLSQWITFDATQKTNAEGVNLLNYLRGRWGYENRSPNIIDNWLYRTRESTLGDALESQPAYISKPVFNYTYAGYDAYKLAQINRAGSVFMGTNDGMLHAFAADTGIERWAYIPSQVIPDMWRLADFDYSTQHRNFVNGSVATSDVYCPGNCGGLTDAIYGDSKSWRTILVGGLNGGGRGYFALDITVPNTPVLLWEITPSTGIGKIKDDDMGYSYGKPLIVRKADINNANDRWVVLLTSGYDNGTLSGNPLIANTPAGSGKGFLYMLDAITGTIISKIDTGVGTPTTPSGLAKISVWNDEPGGNKAGYVYGGDLLGNVWRFNINDTATTATIGTGNAFKFAVLGDASPGTPQPITTTPILGDISKQRMILIGTGQYLSTTDLATTQKQTQYGIIDDDKNITLSNPRSVLVQQVLSEYTDPVTLIPDSSKRQVTSNTVDLSLKRGWYIDFPDKALVTNASERANIDAKLVSGTLLVPTIVPSNTDCSPGGWGWLTFINYQTGGALTTGLASEKFDATIVGVNVVYVQGEPQVLVVTSADPTPHEPPVPPPFTGGAAKFQGKRMIWRELIQQ